MSARRCLIAAALLLAVALACRTFAWTRLEGVPRARPAAALDASLPADGRTAWDGAVLAAIGAVVCLVLACESRERKVTSGRSRTPSS